MIEKLLQIAADATKIILEKYEGELSVEWKGVNDPVTALDKEVNAFVVETLEKSFPGVPVIAEESDPASWAARSQSAAFFVDPIDGTRDLIERTGDFCVMLGFVEDNRPTKGVIAWPTKRRTFFGERGNGAWELSADGSRKPIRVAPTPKDRASTRTVISRYHSDPKTLALLDSLGMRDRVEVGSAGLKVLRVATGEADAYVHLTGGGKLWDSCAPEAILAEAGGLLTDGQGRTLDYRGDLGLNGMIAATPDILAWLRT